jgi:hypothetical protein
LPAWHEPGGAHCSRNIQFNKEISVKTFVNSILITGTLAIFTASSMVAQTSSGQFDQWYRAKYGRPSPSEQARPQTAQGNSTSTVTTPTVPGSQFEQWYRAKYGRPSPTEQALAQAPQSNLASPTPRMVAVSESGRSAKTPAEHRRIAQSYRDQAQDYLAQAKEHEAMVAAYKANPSLTAKNQAGTINHCEYFAAKFNEMASKSNELAQLHEQMAKDAATK